MITWIQVLSTVSSRSRMVRLKGLDENMEYKIEGEDVTMKGDTLIYAGMPIPAAKGDFVGGIIHLIGK